MQGARWLVLALALVQGGWLTFDGARALWLGDYVTPASGAHAGQLGPWSHVVSALGFAPRGTFIKILHVVLGMAWLAAATLCVVRPAAGNWPLACCAVATLWYLPFGTILSLLVLALLTVHGFHG